jgi:hypothetical protein
MKIESFSESSPSSQNLTACIYGPSGSGKTTLASTFPKPILFFDFDNKLETIPQANREGIFHAKFPFTDVNEAPAMFEDFKLTWKKVKRKSFTLPNGETPATVVLDSVTLFDIMSIHYFMKEAGKNLDTEKPSLPVYGSQSNFYNSFFAGINSFPCNLVCTFHEFYKEDENGVLTGIQPLITGKRMLNKIPAIFQETWYMDSASKGNDKLLYYRPYRRAVANSIRLKGDKGVIENPTYESIIKEMK